MSSGPVERAAARISAELARVVREHYEVQIFIAHPVTTQLVDQPFFLGALDELRRGRAP